MRTIKYRSQGSDVYFLEELLTQLGYKVFVSNCFGIDTHNAVIDYQKKNGLVVDGRNTGILSLFILETGTGQNLLKAITGRLTN